MNQVSMPQIKNEIFRHLRPLWYNKDKHELTPQPNGGISFLLIPTELGNYNYWLYSCPPSISFSSRQAVHSLRQAFHRGIVNWGVIQSNEDSPLIYQAVRDVIAENCQLPTDVSRQALDIVITNAGQEFKKSQAEKLMKQTARVAYEES